MLNSLGLLWMMMTYLQTRVISINACFVDNPSDMIGALFQHVLFPLMGLCSKLFGLGMMGYFVYSSAK